MDFYQGKVLRIDLNEMRATKEPLRMDWAELYVGGKGLLFRYLLDEVEPGLDPWSPNNPLMFFTGPFAGTGVSTCSRLVVGCKSPQTGTILDSYVGGSFAPELKFAGYDALIVTGRAAAPTIIWVKDDVVELLSATSYMGMKISELEAALRRDLDPCMRAISNGPAGENLLPWACLSTDQAHKAGRGGAGALMGTKNVKAIAVRGTGSVSVGDAKAFAAELYTIQEESVLTPANMWAHEEGTLALVDVVNMAGAMPTRNWSQGQFDGIEQINSAAFQKVRLKKRACSQCAIGCRNVHEIADARGEGPEYETVAICGANCCVGDTEALLRFNVACDDLGMDTISTGAVVALATEMTEEGIADFGLHFGDYESYVAATGWIARREGVGAELADGARALALRYGVPELAVEVKNLELPGYDPRGTFGMSLAYATADRGGCHQRSYVQADEILGGDLPPDTLDGKAAVNIRWQNFTSVKYSGIWCEFWALELADMGQLLRHVYQRELSDDELMRIGERAWNLARLFNVRENVEPDDLPRKLYAPEGAFIAGPSAGKVIGEARFQEALQEYYRLRGWDEQGVPSEAKLVELGIEVRV